MRAVTAAASAAREAVKLLLRVQDELLNTSRRSLIINFAAMFYNILLIGRMVIVTNGCSSIYCDKITYSEKLILIICNMS